jgi:recombination protein RecR
METPQPIQNFVKTFSRLPGLGPKTALRYALYILGKGEADINDFTDAISELKQMRKCLNCFSYNDQEEKDVCSICANEERKNKGLLCVVENFKDLIAIENTSRFEGTFHVLGGVLNPLMGIGPNELAIKELVERVKKESVQQIILALNPSVEGDATCSYLNDLLKDRCQVERIGFGIPMGGSLEYLDNQTILTALENRKTMAQ